MVFLCFQLKHPLLYEDFMMTMKSKCGGGAPVTKRLAPAGEDSSTKKKKCSIMTQQRLDEICVHLIADASLSFSIVENAWFQALVTG